MGNLPSGRFFRYKKIKHLNMVSGYFLHTLLHKLCTGLNKVSSKGGQSGQAVTFPTWH